MSEQEINIAIAEARGWAEIDGLSAKGLMGKPPGKLCSFDYLPDCCNDLNAMHEATMSLEGPIRDHSFRRALAKSVGVIGVEDWEHSLVCLDKLTNATARQRAEAFLRTIGKWEEGAK